MLKIRVGGDPEEVAELVSFLRRRLPAFQDGYRVQQESAPYPNRRGPGVRVYLDVEPNPKGWINPDLVAEPRRPGAPDR